jgi:NAD(P)-dependent dehydrogenase (short-subunit alcohol dehydrogenase family)
LLDTALSSKAGLHSLTQHLAIELAQYQIRVNAVAPAVVETPIYGGFIEPEKVHTTLQGFNHFHPIERIGQPVDVVEVSRFWQFADTKMIWEVME